MVSIRKAYAGYAKRIAMGVWSTLRQFMYTKWVIVVDDDIDCRDCKDVMWANSTRMDPARRPAIATEFRAREPIAALGARGSSAFERQGDPEPRLPVPLLKFGRYSAGGADPFRPVPPRAAALHALPTVSRIRPGATVLRCAAITAV